MVIILEKCVDDFRPIGAVVYMQRNNLKMCLRSTDSATDTSEIAKVWILDSILLRILH